MPFSAWTTRRRLFRAVSSGSSTVGWPKHNKTTIINVELAVTRDVGWPLDEERVQRVHPTQQHVNKSVAECCLITTSSSISVLLQRVSIACYAERCTIYSKFVRLSVRLSVTRWHCVKPEYQKQTENNVPVRWYVEPVFRLQSRAYKSTSMSGHQIKLLSNFNAHVQWLIAVFFALYITF